MPDGMELDHLCEHKWCRNPKHVEPVTKGENIRRAFASNPMKLSDEERSNRAERCSANSKKASRNWMRSEQERAKRSARMKERMADPEYAAKVRAARWPKKEA